jgi:hypothetical protein
MARIGPSAFARDSGERNAVHAACKRPPEFEVLFHAQWRFLPAIAQSPSVQNAPGSRANSGFGRSPTPPSRALLAPMSPPARAASSFAVSSMSASLFALPLFSSTLDGSSIRSQTTANPSRRCDATGNSPSTRTRGYDERRRGLEGVEEEAKNELNGVAFGKRRYGSDLRNGPPCTIIIGDCPMCTVTAQRPYSCTIGVER